MHSKFMLMFRQLSIERWNKQPTRESKKMAGVYAPRSHKANLAGLVSKIAASSPKVIKDGLLYGAMVDHKVELITILL